MVVLGVEVAVSEVSGVLAVTFAAEYPSVVPDALVVAVARLLGGWGK